MTATAPAVAGSERDGIALRVDTKGLEDAFVLGPSTCYYWLRTFLFSSFLAHRTYWLRAKGTKFGRASSASKAIKVWGINKAPTSGLQPNWVTYHVLPNEKRQPDPKRAREALGELYGEAGAGSIVLEVHQKGTDIRVPGWLTIPLKTKQRSAKAWRAANPGKPLIAIPDPRNANRLYLAERIRYRGRRAAAAAAAAPGAAHGSTNPRGRRTVVRDRLRRRFLLVHAVDMKPTLNFYESWDSLAGERTKEFSNIANRITGDIARGKFA